MVGGKAGAWRAREAEKKRVEKAATLRKYAKLCKKEGIESSRVRLAKNDGEQNAPKPRTPVQKKPKPQKSLVVEAEKIAEQRAAAKEQQRKERLQSVEEALHKRKEKRKLATAKNSKGQPLFKGKILHILEKLQK